MDQFTIVMAFISIIATIGVIYIKYQENNHQIH